MTREEMVRIKEERGYSFKQLAEYSGVPAVTLQKIFSGETRTPRQVTMDAIERVLTSREEQYQGKAYMLQNKVYNDCKVVRENAENIYGLGKRQGEYTIEDYYALPDEQRVELIDGIIYDMSSPRTVHQDITFLIHKEFYDYIRKKNKNCKVFEAPVDVQISCDNKTMVQPDVIVICDRDKVRGFGIFGAPDFVLEVLSKSTKRKDMFIKANKYQESGVREYWMIDPDKQILIVYDWTRDTEDCIPVIHQLYEKVTVAISDGELVIDLEMIAESIRELGSLE